jgi:hypothetical protein
MRTALAYGTKTQPFEQTAHLGGLEDWHGCHSQVTAML